MSLERVLGVEQFASPQWLGVLWFVPIAFLLIGFSIARRRGALGRFADRTILGSITKPVSTVRLCVRAALLCSALALVAVALARPLRDRSERTVQREGRDVVFIVDVSRSMLADDLAPNRLERVKIWIRDVVPTIEGDRVGLIAFAGTSVVKSPLTLDYAYFDLSLEELSSDSVSLGGTNIGDALRKATQQVFDSFEGRFRDVILLTDGEDQGSAPIEAARAAAERGIRLIALGIGDDGAGAPIPNPDPRSAGEYILDDRGGVVRSRLDRDTLEAMARATPGGVYVHVGTGNVELDSLYADLIKDAEKSVVQEETIVEFDERFQTYLAIAVVLLLAQCAFTGIDP